MMLESDASFEHFVRKKVARAVAAQARRRRMTPQSNTTKKHTTTGTNTNPINDAELALFGYFASHNKTNLSTFFFIPTESYKRQMCVLLPI